MHCSTEETFFQHFLVILKLAISASFCPHDVDSVAHHHINYYKLIVSNFSCIDSDAEASYVQMLCPCVQI